jgi:hypothetical protein
MIIAVLIIIWGMLMRAFEFGLCVLLALAGLGHLTGTFLFYTAGTDIFVWSLSASAFVFAIVFLHAVRILRPEDALIGNAAIVFSLIWVALAFLFALAEGNPADPRALMHIAASGGLAITALRQRTRCAQGVSKRRS